MSEEPNKNEATEPKKLLIDGNANFQLLAAYNVYSELFDGAADSAVKADLNRNIEALKEGRIDCETFYRNIAHYRNLPPNPPSQNRITFETQRKRDWRIKSQRQERIRRHKK